MGELFFWWETNILFSILPLPGNLGFRIINSPIIVFTRGVLFISRPLRSSSQSAEKGEFSFRKIAETPIFQKNSGLRRGPIRGAGDFF